MVKMSKFSLWFLTILTLFFGFSTVSTIASSKKHVPVAGNQKQNVQKTKKENSFLNTHLLEQAAQGKLSGVPFSIGDTYKRVRNKLVKQGNSEFGPASNEYVGFGPEGAYTHGFFKLALDKNQNKQLWFETDYIKDTDTVRLIHIRKWNITKDMVIKVLGNPTHKVVDDASGKWVFEYERGRYVLTFSHRASHKSVEVSIERNFDC